MLTRNTSKGSCCQSGRSMIEILGVVCLIGVLSVGSLLLYSYVIAKNQANTIQTMANERAASIMTSPSLANAAVNEVLEAVGFASKENGYEWEHRKVSKNTFMVGVSGVRKRACEILIGMDFSYLEKLTLNDKCVWAQDDEICDGNARCSESGNTFAFVYNGLSLKRAAVCTKQQKQCGLECCESYEYCIKSGGRMSASRCCANKTDIVCDGGCCPQGATCCGENCCTGTQTCCNDTCYSPCVGVGYSGQRDSEDCSCACDEEKGFVKKEGVCQCPEGKTMDGSGKCVCVWDSILCDETTGATKNEGTCECECPGGKHLYLGRCVECVETSDCDPAKCQTCEGNVCVGQCCVDLGDECVEGTPCCDSLPCTDGTCCVGMNGDCFGNKDNCCNDELDCHAERGCCAPLGVSCSGSENCCDDALGCSQTTGSESVCCVTLQKEGCSKEADCCGGITCTEGTCCIDKQKSCLDQSECCNGLSCTKAQGDTTGTCCQPLGVACRDEEDCCLGKDKEVYTCEGTCCVPFGDIECVPVDENDTKGYCCGNYSCVGHRCCLPPRSTGCSTDLQDCCGGVACTEKEDGAVCCQPINTVCSSADVCCDENHDCAKVYDVDNSEIVLFEDNTVCCIPKKGIGCSENDDCCGNMACTDGACCIFLQNSCSEASDCCLGTCSSNTRKETDEQVCCLETQTTGCRETADCCGGISCTMNNSDMGTCCMDVTEECFANDECCGYVASSNDNEGYYCKGFTNTKAGNCCPSAGWCSSENDECEICCTASNVPECTWSDATDSGWVGTCNKSATDDAVYGYGYDSPNLEHPEMRCCKEGEYLVPGFTDAISQDGKITNRKYCCPDENESSVAVTSEDNIMKFAYYDETAQKCSMLGECPVSYDGIVLILDISISMTDQNKFKTIKSALSNIFNSTDYNWNEIKVGIYPFNARSQTGLEYGKYAPEKLLEKLDNIEEILGTGDDATRTCIGCGLKAAAKDVLASGSNAPLFIVMSDGEENIYPKLSGTGKDTCVRNASFTGNVNSEMCLVADKNAGKLDGFAMPEKDGNGYPYATQYVSSYIKGSEIDDKEYEDISDNGVLVYAWDGKSENPYIYNEMYVRPSITNDVTEMEDENGNLYVKGKDLTLQHGNNLGGTEEGKIYKLVSKDTKVKVPSRNTSRGLHVRFKKENIGEYASARYYINEINEACENVSSVELYTMTKVTADENFGITFVLKSASEIAARLTEAFAKFKNCIPPKGTTTCESRVIN